MLIASPPFAVKVLSCVIENWVKIPPFFQFEGSCICLLDVI
jgi:hypothetical protein